MSWVDGSEPPFLLIHGTSDTRIPSWMAEDFASALEESGVPVKLLLFEGGHVESTSYVQSLETIEAWLTALFKE